MRSNANSSEDGEKLASHLCFHLLAQNGSAEALTHATPPQSKLDIHLKVSYGS